MFLMSPGMQRIYEVLAFIVALYFPVALLTWLVIDKFFTAADGKGHVMQQQTASGVRQSVLSKRSRR